MSTSTNPTASKRTAGLKPPFQPKAKAPKAPAPTRAELETQLEQLQQQCQTAQYYAASDGRQLNLAELNQAKHRHVIDEYPATEQDRIRERLSRYKQLQGQLGHVKRRLNSAGAVGSDGKTQHVLDKHKEVLLEWFTRHYDPREVHRRVVLELGLEHVSYPVVRKWKERHQDLILANQRAARDDLSDLRFVHKRNRLEAYHDQYAEAFQRYEQTHSRADRQHCKDILEAIRKEVEGEVIHATLDVNATVTVTLEQRIQAELTRNLPLHAIVLAGIAVARGIDPTFLLTRLRQSYYARFNGFVSGAESANGPSEEFVFPSEQGYDFGKIEALHRSGQGGAAPAAPLPALLNVEPAQKAVIAGSKAELLRRLGLG